MARKQFLLKYQDGSKKHIGCAERDSLLLDGLIRQIAVREYAYIGQCKTFHSFAELETLKIAVEPQPLKRRFLPGSFIVEFANTRRRELLETPEAMTYRLQTA